MENEIKTGYENNLIKTLVKQGLNDSKLALQLAILKGKPDHLTEEQWKEWLRVANKLMG